MTVNPTAKVGDALDLTVAALSKDGSVNKNYTGNIYISVSEDPKATVPFADNGYTFTAEDQGTKTFSKGLIFSKDGHMTVTVIDLENEQITGNASVTVSPANGTSTGSSNEQISVTSPTNGSVITTDNVDVVGTTKKDSKVKFLLNGKEVGETQSDPSGAFLFNVKGLLNDKNAIQAEVIDGTDAVAGQTDNILITVQNGGPQIKSVTIQEGNSIPAGSTIHVSLISDPQLKEVVMNVKNTVQVMQEDPTNPGTYTGSMIVPKDLGNYTLGAKLTSSLGLTTQKPDAVPFTIVAAQNQNIFGPIKVEAGDKKATLTFTLTIKNDDIAKFKIVYGTSSGLLSQSSITDNKEKIVYGTGTGLNTQYRWYIPNLDYAHYYFQIIPIGKDGNTMDNLKSSVVDADLSLHAAPNTQCVVDNITSVNVKKLNDSYVLSWDPVASATSGYNVYKKDDSGEFQLIETVTDPSYTVNVDMTQKQIQYSEFAIKGLCNTPAKAESPDFSPSTRVQTGPEGIVAILAISLGLGYLLIRRRRTAR